MKVKCDVIDTAVLSREELLSAIGMTLNPGDSMIVSAYGANIVSCLVVKITRKQVETEMPARVGDDPWKHPAQRSLYDRDSL